MATATGASIKTGLATPSRSRNLNILQTTAQVQPVGKGSKTPYVRPTLVQAGSTKPYDYLIVAGLVIALLVLAKEG